MKLQQLILAGVLLLASFAAQSAAAVPDTAEPRPADVFGVSVMTANGDCDRAPVQAAAHGEEPSGVDPWSTCGKCGPDICDGRLVGAFCGIDNGRYMNCQDYLGMLCPIEDGVRCRCSADPLP